LESAKKQMLKKQVWNEKRNNNNATTLNNQSVEAHTTTTTATTTTTKKESKKEKSGDILLPDSWIANEDHYELGFKLGLDTLTIKEEVAVMRSWSLGNGEKRRNWDHVFNNWLKRKAKEKINGHGGPRPLQDDSKSISRAAGRLAEAARRGEFGFGPIPSLLPRKDDDPVLLLPKGRGT
jgi:hypothetical protein